MVSPNKLLLRSKAYIEMKGIRKNLTLVAYF
jgi:hypothetical protein